MKKIRSYSLLIVFYLLFFIDGLSATEAKNQKEDAVGVGLHSECLIQYKKCATDILNKVDTFYKAYQDKEQQCNENINTIKSAEYDYVFCQDQLGDCKGESDSVWQRINYTKDISLLAGNPNQNGLNDSTLKKIKEGSKAIPKLKSLLISRDDKLIFEEYYAFKEDSKPHHIWSVTKSIMSLLVGVAIDKGYLESEKLLIKPFFPEFYEKEHDPRKDDISIEHALTMTTGINFTDNNNWYDWSSYEPYPRDDNARNWILDFEMLLNYQPGGIWLYGSPNTDLLSSIIHSSTRLSTLEFAEKYLFEPLNIKNYFWLHDSSENYVGGFTLFLRPRALMRIGQMVLNGGTYEGKRIISEQWLNTSLSSHVELGGEEGYAYGYSWWRFSVGAHQAISAFGYGGQLITLVPELNLVIVTTSDSHSACTKKSMEDQFNAVLELVKMVILNVEE